MKKIIKQIYILVEKTCRKKSNYYGYRAWTHHILPVVKYAKLLAKKLHADEEIVEIAALLHDYASVLDKRLYKNHHVHGAKLAEVILKKYHYPEKRIEQIKHCIFTHRGSKTIKRETKEAKIIASADAMSHFDNVPSLLELAFVVKKMNTSKGTKFVREKIERGYKKLMPEAKVIMKEKYQAIKIVLSDNNR